MRCFHPLTAWQLESGDIVFAERGKILRELQLPCGQCVGCRLRRSCEWAVRCVHESKSHDSSSFVTLTYNDENLGRGSLNYRDFQLFMKKLRKQFGPTRFFMCGEYGDDNFRPHFHACLFGLRFDDLRHLRKLPSGSNIYSSAKLDALWTYGFASVGDVTFESAAYVARYCVKKVTGRNAVEHYKRFDRYTGEIYDLEPEFCHMSLKPGIGWDFWQKYRSEISGTFIDRVVMAGAEKQVPRYYDKLLDKADGFGADLRELLRHERRQRMNVEDSSPERLAVQETVAKARLAFSKRSI